MSDGQRILVHDLALIALLVVAFIGGHLHHPNAAPLALFGLLFGALYCAVIAARR